MSAKRMLFVFGSAIAAVLAAAWYQGGAEPLRPIVQPVPVPEGAR